MRNLADALGAFGGSLAGRGSLARNKADDESMRKRYRTIFKSDLHLGTPGCQARALLDFESSPKRQSRTTQ